MLDLARRAIHHHEVCCARLVRHLDTKPRGHGVKAGTPEVLLRAVGFIQRANLWFNQLGITIERVITDNGSCYKSNAWRDCLEDLGITPKRTRPYRPQTNGKIERYHRILLEEWAYIRDWNSDAERSAACDDFVHFYNHHRAHGALGWSTPLTTLEDNVTGQHS